MERNERNEFKIYESWKFLSLNPIYSEETVYGCVMNAKHGILLCGNTKHQFQSVTAKEFMEMFF